MRVDDRVGQVLEVIEVPLPPSRPDEAVADDAGPPPAAQSAGVLDQLGVRRANVLVPYVAQKRVRLCRAEIENLADGAHDLKLGQRPDRAGAPHAAETAAHLPGRQPETFLPAGRPARLRRELQNSADVEGHSPDGPDDHDQVSLP